MSELFNEESSADKPNRTAQEIRKDIEESKEKLSQTVHELGQKINRQLDWREYMREYPAATLGVVAGIGLLAAKMFVPKRHPVDKIVDQLHNFSPQSSNRPGLVHVALSGLLTKVAGDWFKNMISGSDLNGGSKKPKHISGKAGRASHSEERNIYRQ